MAVLDAVTTKQQTTKQQTTGQQTEKQHTSATAEIRLTGTGAARTGTGRQSARYEVSVLLAIDVIAALSPALAICDMAGPVARVLAIALPFGWVLALLCYGGYRRSARRSARRGARRAVEACMAAAAVTPVICLLSGQSTLISVATAAIVTTAALTLLGRIAAVAALRAMRRRSGRHRALIVGPSTSVAGIVAAIRRDRTNELSPAAICVVDDPAGLPPGPLPLPVLCGCQDIAATASTLGCPTVIVVPSAHLDGIRLRRLAWALMDADIDLIIAPTIEEVVADRVTMSDVGGRLLLHIQAPRFSGPLRLAKEFLDRSAAAVLLIIAAPLMGLIALLIRLTSPGPAVFRQRRVGRNGREFTCLKFRTMTVDADRRREELAHLNERGEGLLFKIRHDPRVTPIGSWLRRSSLDELPQLVNVLRGEMSLVGPRPPLPSEVANYDEDLRRRLLVKPGLTGLWQVSGRSELPWPEAVRLDLTYVDNWSPALDTEIMLRTAAAVVRGTGAY
ncbi:MAG: sugar transferase [Micromonosporaceae bacterium]|nr:sugar transferase [Micromonosporaceae bacterium]